MILYEKSKSASQQRLMGMVHAYQSGKLNLNDLPNEKLRKKIKSIASSIGYDDAVDFASTSHKGLPEKVPENLIYLKKIIREEILKLIKVKDKMK